METTGLITLAVLVTLFLTGAEMAKALEPIPAKSNNRPKVLRNLGPSDYLC